jgi:hypothetical protein
VPRRYTEADGSGSYRWHSSGRNEPHGRRIRDFGARTAESNRQACRLEYVKSSADNSGPVDPRGPLHLRAELPDELGDAGRLRCGEDPTSVHFQESPLPAQASAESTLPRTHAT